MREKVILLFIITISNIVCYSQTKADIDLLNSFSQNEKTNYKTKKREAERWAVRNNKPVRFIKGSAFYEIQFLENDSFPRYFKTCNATAASTISTDKLYLLGDLGLNLSGLGITAREWDAGSALTTHQEFGSRITVVDSSSVHYHATHIAGTIMASGVVVKAKGMAYEASLRSFDWSNDNSEMAGEAAGGMLVSNHSYVITCGWEGGEWYGDTTVSKIEDYAFGFYNVYAQYWDYIANIAPYYLICKAVGNDRNDTGDGSYPDDGPYDCIPPRGIAKNILTIGSVHDIPGGYTNSNNVEIAVLSSWGPADDGRIKPDIVANGYGLYSAHSTSNTSYATRYGTSMSTASVTGSLILLQQHYYNIFSRYMLASTLKALVIHTADETGPYPGPDYMFGWGLMNTAKAANLISTSENHSVIIEATLTSGATQNTNVVANGAEPLKVTIVWNDPYGTPPSISLDPVTPMLVNDLDLKVTQSSNTFYPWKLDLDNPEDAATNSSENNVDNVEVVYIAEPVAGTTYTITVDHDDSLSGSSQDFSMIISGIEPSIEPVANFSVNNTQPLANEIIKFSDLSINIPTSWLWSITPASYKFENGTCASSRTPEVSFYSLGNYTVSLTATNSLGSDTITKPSYIQIEEYGVQENYTVTNITVNDGESECFNATDTLNVAGNGTTVELNAGSTTNFIAGGSIFFLPGFHAQDSCYMSAYITTDGSFCNQMETTSAVILSEKALKNTSANLAEKNLKIINSERGINIYPNPSPGVFNVELQNFTQPVNLKIYNQQGAIIYSTEQESSNKAAFDISYAPRGLYVVKVIDQNEYFTRKIILE